LAESITRAWRIRASLADAGAFRAWMLRILNNTFVSERRKTLARPREGGDAGQLEIRRGRDHRQVGADEDAQCSNQPRGRGQ
jgi:DNA-directed RNA polymerase specialized sigma24 family protein